MLFKAVVWHLCQSFRCNHELQHNIQSFMTMNHSELGEVKYGRNSHNIATLMHVDKTLPMWAFFDIYGSTQKIKCLGESWHHVTLHNLCASCCNCLYVLGQVWRWWIDRCRWVLRHAPHTHELPNETTRQRHFRWTQHQVLLRDRLRLAGVPHWRIRAHVRHKIRRELRVTWHRPHFRLNRKRMRRLRRVRLCGLCCHWMETMRVRCPRLTSLLRSSRFRRKWLQLRQKPSHPSIKFSLKRATNPLSKPCIFLFRLLRQKSRRSRCWACDLPSLPATWIAVVRLLHLHLCHSAPVLRPVRVLFSRKTVLVRASLRWRQEIRRTLWVTTTLSVVCVGSDLPTARSTRADTCACATAVRSTSNTRKTLSVLSVVTISKTSLKSSNLEIYFEELNSRSPLFIFYVIVEKLCINIVCFSYSIIQVHLVVLCVSVLSGGVTGVNGTVFGYVKKY